MSILSTLYNQYKSLKLNEIQNYDRYNELLLIHSSSVMEGSTLTLDETEMLIEEDTTPKGKPLEHSLMIKDHYEALKYVIEQSKKIKHISEPVIKKIGAMVMRSTGGSYYVSHDKILSMMNDLYQNVNKSINEVSSVDDIMTLSSYAHLQLLTIHPFVDGNGRSARLLQNLILLKHNLPLLIIRHENKSDYIAAIKNARAKEDVQPFQKFPEHEYTYHLKLEIDKAQAMKKGKSGGTSFTVNL